MSRYFLIPVVLLAVFLNAGHAYASCSSPAGNEADRIYNQAYHTWQFCNGTSWIPLGGLLISGGGGAGCSNPAGNEADQIYNASLHTWQFCNGTQWISAGGNNTYLGPGDIVSGATAWYGLRGYNAAAAASNLNAINIRRASDNTTTNIVILSNGNLDTTTAASFAGTDATCTGTISSTTLSVTSCSGTLHVNDPISGTGITQPAYITAIGTCASPPGTCTLNAAQTVSSGETITAQVALFVAEAYDQTGNGHNATQSTTTIQPQFLFTCISNNPCMKFQNQYLSATIPSLTQPYSMSLVFNQFALTGTPNEEIATTNAILETSTTGLLRWLSSTTATCATITAGSSYSYQTVFDSTTSDCELNGTLLTGQAAGTTATGTALTFGIPTSGGTLADYYSPEFGLWPSDTHASWTTLNSNQRTYWNF